MMGSGRRRLEAVGRRMPDAPPSEAELMGRVALGDQAAFAAVYDLYADRVYGLVRRVVRDPAQAEEVAQEVFTDAWRTARSFDAERGSLASWLLTMAHRRAVDRVRSEQASRDRAERVAVRDQHLPYDSVAEQVEVQLEHEQVRRALAGLTDLQRQAIELAYYGGNTYREVAELLDTPLPTIKTRLRDGMIRMRDQLGVSA